MLKEEKCTVPLSPTPCRSLDNVCAEPNPSDSRYLDGLHKTYARHQDFPRTAAKDMVRIESRGECHRLAPEGGQGQPTAASNLRGKCFFLPFEELSDTMPCLLSTGTCIVDCTGHRRCTSCT